MCDELPVLKHVYNLIRRTSLTKKQSKQFIKYTFLWRSNKTMHKCRLSQILAYLCLGYTYLMSSVWSWTILPIKLSLMIIPRIAFQSVAPSPINKHAASRANLTAGGGFPIERISTKSFFLIELTAEANINRFLFLHVNSVICNQTGRLFITIYH